MPAIVIPAALPVPSVAPLTPTERRDLTPLPGPRVERVRQRDFNGQQQIEWAVLSRAQLAVLRAWWHDDLVEGGAWFAAPWPMPAGWAVTVRKFLAEPQRTYLGNGYWRVSATCEVRGRGELPQAPAAGGAAIGWLAPVGDAGGTAAHANAGTGYFSHVNPALRTPPTVYAGVVGYAGQTVSWSSTWTPVASDVSPTVTGLGGGLVSVNWGSVFSTRKGMLVLTATIDGVPIAAGQRLVFTNDPALEPGVSFYDPIAWGPEP